ncbi:hypothetical protein [Nocardia rhizosphaerae]|uniref:Mce-associated membrane protein n=1 Tax=Nocardia rhizosphaerae TaxID=1691571 RepID=A0ABV8LC98_9NOCA
MTTDQRPATTDDPGTESSEPAGEPPRHRLHRLMLPTAAVITVGAVVLASWLAADNQRIRSREQARDTALRAACAYAPTLAHYDAADLDTYFAAVLAGATGDWKTEFEATSKDLRDVLTQGQVVSTVGNVTCAIESADETTARAVAVINQTITSLGTNGTPAPGQLSVTMTLRKNDDRWLVSEIGTPLLAP